MPDAADGDRPFRPHVKGGICRDCGRNQAPKDDYFCGQCRGRHHPRNKTRAIVRFYEGRR